MNIRSTEIEHSNHLEDRLHVVSHFLVGIVKFVKYFMCTMSSYLWILQSDETSNLHKREGLRLNKEKHRTDMLKSIHYRDQRRERERMAALRCLEKFRPKC